MLGLDIRAARFTWTAALVILLMATVYWIRETLLVFTIALMFAYLLYPLFDWLQTRAHARTPALALTFLLVLGFIGGFATFIGNRVGFEAKQLAAQLQQPGWQQHFADWRVFDIPIGAQITEHYSEIAARIPTIAFHIISASSNVLDLIIIPILAFFILNDGLEIREAILNLFASHRSTIDALLDDAHTLMLQYMRALLFLCLATLIVFSAVLTLMGVPYGMLLASVAFMLEFIPMIGPLSAAAIILAISFFGGYPHIAGLVAFLGIYRLFQDYVLSPHLMRRGVELHPLAVIFGIFAGGEIGGVAGIFLSVPTLALIRLIYYRMTNPVRRSRPIEAPATT